VKGNNNGTEIKYPKLKTTGASEGTIKFLFAFKIEVRKLLTISITWPINIMFKRPEDKSNWVNVRDPKLIMYKTSFEKIKIKPLITRKKTNTILKRFEANLYAFSWSEI